MDAPYSCFRPSEMSDGPDTPTIAFNNPQASSITWMDINLLKQLFMYVYVKPQDKHSCFEKWALSIDGPIQHFT
jgi:hypothetical protein